MHGGDGPYSNTAVPGSGLSELQGAKSLNSAIVTINENGYIQSVDRRTCQLFGYSPDELQGKKINVLIPSPYREQHDTYLENYLQTGSKKIIDKSRLVEGLHKDGSIFPIILSVTEVKVWNMRMFIGAIERVPDKSLIINTDLNGIITSCNRNCEEMLGYTVPELVGQSVNMLMPAPHNQLHDKYIQDNYHAGGRWRMLGHVRNLPIRHKDGVVFPVCIQVTKVSTGGVVAFRGCIETPPKETVFTIDHDGIIIACNYNFTLPMFGFTHEHLIGKNIRMLIPEMILSDDNSTAEDGNPKKRKHATGQAIEGWVNGGVRRVEVLHKDGSTFVVMLEVIKLRSAGSTLYSLQIKRVTSENNNSSNNNHNHNVNKNDEASAVPSEVIGDYIVGKFLGRGNYGVVKLGAHKVTGKKVAIKILLKDHLDAAGYQRVMREIEILRQLEHPGIARMIDVVEKPDALFLIMEFCGGGDLLSFMSRRKGDKASLSSSLSSSSSSASSPSLVNSTTPPSSSSGASIPSATTAQLELTDSPLGPALKEDEARRIFHQLASAVKHCHALNIIHRDIKHKNVLFDSSGNVKLIDFGLSNWSCQGAMSFCGTPAYAAPEMLLGVQYMGPEVDVWSMGVVLYSLVTGRLPFLSVVDMVVGKFSSPPEQEVSSQCIDLIRRCLVVDTAKRATLQEIMDHPWMRQLTHQPPESSPLAPPSSPSPFHPPTSMLPPPS
jgi:PAS domain S-box-containing protein